MNVGISVPLPAYLVDVGFMARKVEELGFESFWCAEHPFIPVHSASRFPGSADGVIPESYSHFIDPFVALARASGVTSRIKLGAGIFQIPARSAAMTAIPPIAYQTWNRCIELGSDWDGESGGEPEACPEGRVEAIRYRRATALSKTEGDCYLRGPLRG